MEIEKKDSYKKGFKSILISIPIGLLITLIFYFIWLKITDEAFPDGGMGLLGAWMGFIFFSILICVGVIIIVSAFYINSYIKKQQGKALTIAVVNVFVIVALALIFLRILGIHF